MTQKYKNLVEQANVYDVAVKTPLENAAGLSKRLNNEIWIKREDLQPVYSFKLRGAYNKIAQLSDAEKEKGVITASAGNHAQGVALAAKRLGLKALIVMPKTTPDIKVSSVRSLGADIELVGNAYDDAYEHAKERAKLTGMTFVHPYDDPAVIAGQGTIAKEILSQLEQNPNMIFVPVGGGGLAAGIAIAVKEQRPDIEVYGVEASSAASMKTSLEKGKITNVENLDTICDGIAVKRPGKITFKICGDLLSEVVTVDELEVTRTLFMLLERSKIVVEPAGCVGLAAFYHKKIDIEGKTAVAVLSGGNIDMSFLSKVVEKELFRLGRSIRVRGTILDRVGSMNNILSIVSESSVSIIEINQDRFDPDILPNRAELEMILEVPDQDAVKKMMKMLSDQGLDFRVVED